MRITAQLIDASTNGHLWAERYDRDLTDIFSVQDDVTQQIIAALESELVGATATRASRPLTASPEAYDLFLRARLYKERRTRETNARAREMLEQAIALDPTFAAAYAELGHAMFLAWFYGWSEGEFALAQAGQAAEKAIALDPSMPLGHERLAWVRAWQGDLDAAIAAAREAVALDANFAGGYNALAHMLVFTGDTAEAIALTDRAARLDPYSPLTPHIRGVAYFVDQDYERAITEFKASLALNPDFGGAHHFLTAIYGLLGREADARAEAAEVLRVSPDFARGITRIPFKDRSVLARKIDGLRKAGLEVPEVAAIAE